MLFIVLPSTPLHLLFSFYFLPSVLPPFMSYCAVHTNNFIVLLDSVVSTLMQDKAVDKYKGYVLVEASGQILESLFVELV